MTRAGRGLPLIKSRIHGLPKWGSFLGGGTRSGSGLSSSTLHVDAHAAAYASSIAREAPASETGMFAFHVDDDDASFRVVAAAVRVSGRVGGYDTGTR
jgi:hypothetical protein